MKIGDFDAASTSSAAASTSSAAASIDPAEVKKLIYDISDPYLREKSFRQLYEIKEQLHDYALEIWNSCDSLLQEIISVYPLLSPPSLTSEQLIRLRNAIVLFKPLVEHSDTRILFVKANLPFYLYRILNTTCTSGPFVYLRNKCLEVIYALVKDGDTEAINYLVTSKIIPLCFRSMEIESESEKIVVTFIVESILFDAMGLKNICCEAEQFDALVCVLENMLVEQLSPRLLRHMVRCYFRLSEDPRACKALRTRQPEMLKYEIFSRCVGEDETIRMLHQLLQNVAPVLPLRGRDIFKEYIGRRAGIIRALTDGVNKFYDLCDPAKEELCLYGYSNRRWEVMHRSKLAPSVLPKPPIGINTDRDSVDRRNWLTVVAKGSQNWLNSIALHYANQLTRDKRSQLLKLINGLPSVLEAGTAYYRETSCPLCNEIIDALEFVIKCDDCDLWIHANCANITDDQFESMHVHGYKCPSCDEAQ